MSSAWRLSLQYLETSELRVSTKDGPKEKRVLPPKIKGKHYTNMDYLANAELIWLTPNCIQRSRYNPNSDDCYFEQCFTPIEKLGEGSFASVLKVQSQESKRLYAMKIANGPFKSDFDRRIKVKEVEHHVALPYHPNIVQLFNAWEEDRFLYMQLELCSPCVEEGKALSEESCWNILADISQALHCIHESGRGHFDVKVENIFLGDDNLYKLGDFGLMLQLDAKDEIVKEGDAKYVAPELIKGGVSAFTSKADIFSLGITILELAGNLELPNYGDVWRALRRNTFPYQQTKHLSDELFSLLVKMMAREPSSRPSAQEILAHPNVKEVVEKRNLVKHKGLSQKVNYLATFFTSWGWAIAHSMLQVLATVQGDQSPASSHASSLYLDVYVPSSSATNFSFTDSDQSLTNTAASNGSSPGSEGTSHGSSGYLDFDRPSTSATGLITDSDQSSTKTAASGGSSPGSDGISHGSSGYLDFDLPSTSADSVYSEDMDWQRITDDDSVFREDGLVVVGSYVEVETAKAKDDFISSTPRGVFDDNDNLVIGKPNDMNDRRNQPVEPRLCCLPPQPVPVEPRLCCMPPQPVPVPHVPYVPCVPSQIHCDWLGITSPSRQLREASVNKNRLHCPAESLLQFGISPLRLSKECKQDYKEKKRTKIMTPRNLALSFQEDSDDSDC